MRTIKDLAKLRKLLGAARKSGKNIGFVPTMGYFHEGHLSLMRQAKKDNDICVVSIYVNPKQFGPTEDLAAYPRNFKRDSSMARKENVDILFVPPDNDLYPHGYLTYIDVEKISGILCGACRTGHFRGVATIVAKLLNMVQPDRMYLGAKDAQQVAVLRTMVHDLNFPTQIRVMGTVREPDGLAMSSRNVYLTPSERQQAVILFQALEAARQKIRTGEKSAAKVTRLVKDMIAAKTNGRVQYVACVDLHTLEPLKRLEGDILIAVAVFFGKTRLIDNIVLPRHEPRKNKS